jgi:hypothetical protein
MAQQRPMSTPIFDELLREFSIRLEEQREQAEPPAVPVPAPPPATTANTSAAQPANHRHRAD